MIIDVDRNPLNRYTECGNVDIASLYGKGGGAKNYQRARAAKRAVIKICKDFVSSNVWETLIMDKESDGLEKRAMGSVFKTDVWEFMDEEEENVMIQNVISGANTSKEIRKGRRENELGNGRGILSIFGRQGAGSISKDWEGAHTDSKF